ncbi:hypothetical protein AXD18_22935 [Salmonella enterica]|nr:hypothetical protein [Salmonella enterica]EBA3957054.1 hypothetical protein [Salmonella enterica]EBQ1306615.1 hypothetical protein [Salmonella enterica]EBQ1356515.1 hypothetical protein [Salmonella enterica]EBQ1384022.1 hypothetical protein [Salmonella enterica]
MLQSVSACRYSCDISLPHMTAQAQSCLRRALEPDKNILRSIASSEERQEIDPAKLLRAGQEIDAGRGADISGVSRQVTELARNERDIARQTNSIEHGRLPEREEQSLTRTIQKER